MEQIATNRINKWAVIFVTLISMVMVLPFIIFGENSCVTIHDNLDNMLPQFVQSKYFGFFSLNDPVGAIDGTSSAYFGWGGFTLQNLIYYLLPPFTAYVFIFVLTFFLSAFSMYELQKVIFSNTNKEILLVTSFLYAMLPTTPNWQLTCSVLPLAALTFYHLYKGDTKWYWVMLVIPFFLELQCNAFYVCLLWFLAGAFFAIKDKKIDRNILISFIILCIGVVISNFRIFYMRFTLHEELNRVLFDETPIPFFMNFLRYLVQGYYHARSMQTLVIIPLAFIICCIFIFRVRKNKEFVYSKKEGAITEKKLFNIALTGICFILFFSCMSALEEARLLEPIKNLLPPIKGFSLQRAFVLNRPLWFILFSSVLIYITQFPKWVFIVPLVVLVQAGYTMLAGGYYNDSVRTIGYHTVARYKNANLSWKEFYDEELFALIKKDINYNGEPVVAVGYHPMVLLFNRFNTIDAYISYYPAKDAIKFRKLIAPELEVNEKDREYYDGWSGRRYVYNKDLSFQPTKESHPAHVDLRIDMNVFKNEYSGKYILSRAPLSNAQAMGLKELGHWTHSESVYDMYVYEAQ